MKKYIKSWSWKRLFSKSAIKQVELVEIILVLLCFVCCTWAISTLGLENTASPWEKIFLNAFCVVLPLIGIFVIFDKLSIPCMAKDAYTIMIDNQKALCFIYLVTPEHQRPLFELKIIQNKKQIYQNFVTEYFVTRNSNNTLHVIFRKNTTNSWFIIQNDGVHELGTKIQTNVFLKPQTDGKIKKAKLCILCSDGYQVISADYFINHNNLYIPDGAQYTARPKDDSLFVSQKQNMAYPDEYLLIKTNGEYHILGIYCKNDSKLEPFFQEMIVEFSIFRDGLNSIVLSTDSLNDENKYTILHQKKSSSIHFKNQMLLEITDEENIKGILYCFHNSKLHRVYEGKIHSIDFVKHQILGEDNQFYA